jgi:dTDP-4-amino-4,6-dideoxygalactose transaminase
MKVDFFSFSYSDPDLRSEWKALLSSVIDEGTFIGGIHLKDFEESWARFTGSKFAVGVSNGLDGLTLGLRALGIGAGDYVAVPAHTFIATWSSIIAVGANPIGIDVDDAGLMNLDHLRIVAKSIKAVIPVHMHGSVVEMSKLYKICNDSALSSPIRIIEDASQAHGARSPDGNRLGKFSDLVVYSLYPTKNLGALGDAGVITTDLVEIENRIRSLSNYGSHKNNKYLHEHMGYNNRLDSIQASILRKNLEYLESWNLKRKQLSSIYIRELSGAFTILQESRSESVRHHFCILTPERDRLREFLATKGISTEIHYPYVAGTEAMQFIGQNVKFPNAERLAKTTLSLPISQWHNESQIDYVIATLKQWRSHYGTFGKHNNTLRD